MRRKKGLKKVSTKAYSNAAGFLRPSFCAFQSAQKSMASTGVIQAGRMMANMPYYG